MLGAVATKQGILLATITHHDIVPASNLTCLLPKRTIYGRLKCLISLTSWWVYRGVLEHPKNPPPLNTPLHTVTSFRMILKQPLNFSRQGTSKPPASLLCTRHPVTSVIFPSCLGDTFCAWTASSLAFRPRDAERTPCPQNVIQTI